MCGIAGIISPLQSDVNHPRLQSMSDALSHRGPDGDGLWISAEKNAGFSHRRLAVIDLSAKASQPMRYQDRYTITYNGELYNYKSLRNELKKAGFHFHTESDTEVVLAAYACYKEKCLGLFDGMFAFAIWDEQEQILFAARDRFGEKPFYYHHEAERFFFASEMKALWAAGVHKNTDLRMLINYLSLGLVQHASDKSQTFFNDISSLPPAHYLKFAGQTLLIEKYWDLDKQICVPMSEEQAKERLSQWLSASVTSRMTSDIPLGCSLSGGIDSATVLYHMQQHQSSAIKSFSAVFPGFEKDETAYIHKTTQHLQTENHTCTPTGEELIADFQKLMYHQEEPIPSSSIYAQFRVFQLARENGVRVLLDGQGADEVLAGYHRYIHWFLQEKIGRFKFGAFRREKKLLRQHGVPFEWDLRNYVAAYFPSHVAIALEKKSFRKTLHHPDFSKDLTAQLKGKEWDGLHKPIITKLNDILYYDVMTKGLEELLRFSDRNAMAHGCEARLPFLQHEMATYIFSLPPDMKIHQGYTKYLLRTAMNQHLPDEIVWRKDKVAFEPPQKMWMESGRMMDFMHESRKTLVSQGLLKAEVLNRKPQSKHAHEFANYDWRYLTAAQLMNPL
jgi:asparagine synthase (glutamine-hydrolysing)